MKRPVIASALPLALLLGACAEPGSTGTAEERIKTSLMGVLGSPAFPRERTNASDPWYPMSARGDVVVISAGADRVYFKKKSDTEPNDTIGYAPAGQAPANIAGGPPMTVDESDDIIQSTGG